MKLRILSLGAVFALILIVLASYEASSDARHLYPQKNNYADLGRSGLQWRNATAGNVYATTINATNIYGTPVNTTGNATQGNMTVTNNVTATNVSASDTITATKNLVATANFTAATGNVSGLMTADNATVNATSTLNNTLNSGVMNVVGLFTGNNATINSTSTLNNTVNGGVLNVTGLFTANNVVVNGTFTSNLGGPVILGTQGVTANATITATCATVLRVTDLPNGGNILLTFDTPPAGSIKVLVDESGTLGNSTSGGNIVINVTGGTINGLDNVTLTNATQSGGVYDPTTGTNVTAFRFHFPTTTTGFVYR